MRWTGERGKEGRVWHAGWNWTQKYIYIRYDVNLQECKGQSSISHSREQKSEGIGLDTLNPQERMAVAGELWWRQTALLVREECLGVWVKEKDPKPHSTRQGLYSLGLALNFPFCTCTWKQMLLSSVSMKERPKWWWSNEVGYTYNKKYHLCPIVLAYTPRRNYQMTLRSLTHKLGSKVKISGLLPDLQLQGKG